MRCGACSSNASTIAGFTTSTTWNSVSSRTGVASTRTSLTEQFDSGVFDYAHVSMQTAATLSTYCNWCFCVRTAKATFRYWKLLFLSSIFKTAVAQKLCCRFCWNLQRLCRKGDIKAAKRIFNSDTICRSYSDFNFGITFFGTQCMFFDTVLKFYTEHVVWLSDCVTQWGSSTVATSVCTKQ